jgi:hypothetical protein
MLATQQNGSRRQMTFFSKTTEVVPHIQFGCLVKGQKRTASLTHLEDTDTVTLYHVSFSDGHKDAYIPYEAEVPKGSMRKRTLDPYEEAICSDLSVIQKFIKTSERSLTTFRVCGQGGESFNVWLCERRGFYHVYYKGAYHFTLRKRNRWEVGTNGEKGLIINHQLARLICNHLDSHLH